MLDSKKYPTKKYLHFDHKVKIEIAESYVTNPNKIAKHSFLPLIHYVSLFEKNIGKKNPKLDNRPIKVKERDIMYAGHWDNHIYKYYAEVLNEKYYNVICNEVGIDECVTAYRNNKPRKSNIDFAAEIINQIVVYEEAYVLVGDFTHYFDKINHSLLKKTLTEVLKVERLPSDWFNVYRSITKFGYYEKDFIEEQCGSDKSLKAKKQYSYFKQLTDFRSFQKRNKEKHNKEPYGIPQGTAISAVFANVYALNFDRKLKQIADDNGGIYRRYSDDFILVIPKSNIVDCVKMFCIEKKIRSLASEYEINIQEDKTSLFSYENQRVINLHDQEIHHLDYLGFVFDGITVQMRGKSPYKFYRKAKQLIDLAQDVREAHGLLKLPYRKKIYKLYTDMGISKAGCSSFIDYTRRAQSKFDVISPRTQNLMMQQIVNRKKKIEKMLGVKIHTQIR